MSMIKSVNKIKELVAKQAEDEGLWFVAEYITESYFQQELRKLHKIIEDQFGDARIPWNEKSKLMPDGEFTRG